MNTRRILQLGLALLIALVGCGRAPQGTDTTTISPTTPIEPSLTPTARDAMEIGWFAPLNPGTYFIDADLDPSTPLRVVYDVPAEGWSKWIEYPLPPNGS